MEAWNSRLRVQRRQARRAATLILGAALSGVAAVVAGMAIVATTAVPAAAAPPAATSPPTASSGGATPANGASPANPASPANNAAAGIDPVVREVVRMLGSKVSEGVILRWLDTSGKHPEAVGSRELIELKRAGATDKVTEKLLDMANKAAAGETHAGHSATTATDLTIHAGPHAAALHWVIAYHPNFLEDDERWDLYVYIDGRFMAWAKTPLVSFLEKPLEFDRQIAPGHHILRLFEERHVRKPNTSEWENRVRVAPAAFAFDIAPDTPGKMDILVEVRTRGGPVQITVSQGGNEVAKAQPHMPQPEKWEPLCEEDPKLKGPCRPWAELWSGVTDPPSREDVRDQLEHSSFRPNPNGSPP